MEKCPNCNHNMVTIFYGLPSEELIELARQDGIALGGNYSEDKPAYYCYGCNETCD